MEHLIELKDVYKIYQMGEETVHALDGISLTVDPRGIRGHCGLLRLR